MRERSDVDEILAAIDTAVADYTVSEDAVRCNPSADVVEDNSNVVSDQSWFSGGAPTYWAVSEGLDWSESNPVDSLSEYLNNVITSFGQVDNWTTGEPGFMHSYANTDAIDNLLPAQAAPARGFAPITIVLVERTDGAVDRCWCGDRVEELRYASGGFSMNMSGNFEFHLEGYGRAEPCGHEVSTSWEDGRWCHFTRPGE